MYRALYRKYRPQNFDDVVGQDVIVKTLRNSIVNQSFCHAYMFFGSRGTGKTTLSKIFARSVNCLKPIDGNACGTCSNCLHSYEKECVDIIEIDAASNNGVDEIRELKNKISLVPAELKYKVYIIDEVHMLSIGAFNALLKTLEEPPQHAIFILATTDPQKVPDTIISRCQCFSFKRISIEMLIQRMKYVCVQEQIDVEDEVLNEIAISADGGMRDSLGMLDKLSSYTKEKITLKDFAELNGTITKQELIELCDNIFSSNVSAMLLVINNFSNQGKNLIQIMVQLMYFLRDMLVDYYIKDKKVDYPISLIQYLVNSINEKMFDIKKSNNPRIFLEMFFLQFINSMVKNGVENEKNISREIKNINLQDNNFPEMSKSSDIKESLSSVNGNSEIGKEQVMNTSNSTSSDSNDIYMKSEFCLSPKIINIMDIMKARVNNTLAMANKQLLKNEIEKMNLLNDYTFDQEIGYIVCSLLDSKVRAVSDNSVVISYEYDSIVEQNLLNLDKLAYVYNKITGSQKKIAIISDADWEKEKLKYIKTIKDGKAYSVVEEPEEVLEEVLNDDIIDNDPIKLFGDIVEVV